MKANHSKEVQDLIAKLLVKNPVDRLGTKGHLEIKNHAWFSDVDWSKLMKKEVDDL